MCNIFYLPPQVDRGGPAAQEGTLRPGDRLIAVNGKGLGMMKLPELQVVLSMKSQLQFVFQALLYQQDKETVFTVEYDIAKQVKMGILTMVILR